MEQETFDKKQQAGIDGWYILEIFGHQRYAGYLTVQALGIAAMVRLDVPALDERERVTKRPGYVNGSYCVAGATVKEGAVQGYTKFFGVGAIYSMTPCTREACLEAVEEIQPREVMLVSVPEQKQLPEVPTARFYSPEPEDEEEVSSAD